MDDFAAVASDAYFDDRAYFAAVADAAAWAAVARAVNSGVPQGQIYEIIREMFK